MRYVIKVGNAYVAADGSLTDRQADALRTDDVLSGQTPRAVKLVPAGTFAARRAATLSGGSTTGLVPGGLPYADRGI